MFTGTIIENIGTDGRCPIILLSTVSGGYSRRFHKLCLTVRIGCRKPKLVGYGLNNGFSKVLMMLEQNQRVDKILEPVTK